MNIASELDTNDSRVFVIDDDPSVCKGLSRLLHAAGYQTELYLTAADYLQREPYAGAGCLVIDVRMPGMSGIELQQELIRQGSELPVIFLTGHGDLPMGIKAMKLGADDFLTKPVDEESLLDAVRHALAGDRAVRAEKSRRAVIEDRLDRLTPREVEVLHCMLSGAINREIAVELAITEKTVKAHRAKVMAKMEAASAVELGSICAQLNLPSGKPRSRERG